MQQILSPEQAAKILGISSHGVRYLIRAKRLRATLLGRTWLIQESDLKKIVKGKVGRPKTRGA